MPAIHKRDYIYDLFAVNCHIGRSSSGHYLSYCKNFNDNKWYCFDDNNVIPISNDEIESKLLTPMSYMIFYKKK